MNAALAPILAAALAVTLPAGVAPLGRHDRRIIFGFPQSGKTTLAEKLTAPEWRVVWFDPAHDYGRPGRLRLSPRELARWPRLLRDPHLRLVIEPEAESGGALAEEFATVVRLTREAGNLVLVADELGDYGRNAEGVVNSLFRSGATHDGVRSILIAHVATDCPYRCRKMATHVHCLAQPHPEELRALAAAYGDDFAERVERWRPYEAPITWIPPFLADGGQKS